MKKTNGLTGRSTLALILSLLGSWSLLGQEVLLMPSATQPSPGSFLFRSQTQWYEGSGGSQIMLPFSISGGIVPKHSLTLSSAGNFSRTGSGMSDLDIFWKWRFFTRNTGAIDTSRTALLAGVQVPSGTGDWTTGSFNPSAGIVHTKISGRLGLGFSGIYKLNTRHGARVDLTGMNGRGSAWALASSATWRLHPVVYSANSKGAWYFSVEGAWTGGGGGSSIRAGPSLFYEATTWVAEVGWQYYPLTTGGMYPVESMAVVGVRLFF